MKTFIGVNPNRIRYKLALAGVLLLVAMSAWAVAPVEEVKLLADDGAPNDLFGFDVALCRAGGRRQRRARRHSWIAIARR